MIGKWAEFASSLQWIRGHFVYNLSLNSVIQSSLRQCLCHTITQLVPTTLSHSSPLHDNYLSNHDFADYHHSCHQTFRWPEAGNQWSPGSRVHTFIGNQLLRKLHPNVYSMRPKIRTLLWWAVTADITTHTSSRLLWPCVPPIRYGIAWLSPQDLLFTPHLHAWYLKDLDFGVVFYLEFCLLNTFFYLIIDENL